MSEVAAARLYVLLARESPAAVVFRRGPSKRVLLLSWDTETDELREGQWLNGRTRSSTRFSVATSRRSTSASPTGPTGRTPAICSSRKTAACIASRSRRRRSQEPREIANLNDLTFTNREASSDIRPASC